MFAVCCLYPSVSHAFLTKVVGLDGLAGKAGDELRNSIRQAEAALIGIESRFNENIKERIDQIELVVGNTIKQIDALEKRTAEDVDRILSKAVKDINLLEEKFFSELSERIQEVECVGKRIALQDLENALGQLGKFFGTHQIRVTAPELYYGEHAKSCGWFWCPEYIRNFEIKQPFNTTYDEIRAYIMLRLEAATSETPVNTVLVSYEYMADLAAKASCLAPSSADRFRHEYVKYNQYLYEFKRVFGNGVGGY